MFAGCCVWLCGGMVSCVWRANVGVGSAGCIRGTAARRQCHVDRGWLGNPGARRPEGSGVSGRPGGHRAAALYNPFRATVSGASGLRGKRPWLEKYQKPAWVVGREPSPSKKTFPKNKIFLPLRGAIQGSQKAKMNFQKLAHISLESMACNCGIFGLPFNNLEENSWGKQPNKLSNENCIPFCQHGRCSWTCTRPAKQAFLNSTAISLPEAVKHWSGKGNGTVGKVKTRQRPYGREKHTGDAGLRDAHGR